MYSLPVAGRYFLVCSAWGSGLLRKKGRKMSGDQDKFRVSYRGSLVMRDQLIVFSMKRELRKLFFVIRPAGFAWPVKNLNYWTITHPWKWLESIEGDLGMRFAIWSLDVAFQDFAFFKHSCWCKKRLLKGIYCLLSFMIRENEILLCQRPPVGPPIYNRANHCALVKNPYAIYLRTSKRLLPVV